MTETGQVSDIGAAVSDDSFPDVDLALRRGRHIDRDDATWYAFLLDAQRVLEAFYQRYGCELIHKSDGYFYLLPTGDKLGRRQLSPAEMLVGQALALLYLDPKTIEGGGVVSRDDVLGHMASVMTTDGLMQALNPKKRRLDERVAQETVRNKVAEAVRRLSNIGFVELVTPDQIRLRAALMRFAEPVRSEESPREALAKLVAKGEVVLEAPQALDETDDIGDEPSDSFDEASDAALQTDEADDESELVLDTIEEGVADHMPVPDTDSASPPEGDRDTSYSAFDESEPEATEEPLDPALAHRERMDQRLAEFDDGGDEFDQAGQTFDPDKSGV